MERIKVVVVTDDAMENVEQVGLDLFYRLADTLENIAATYIGRFTNPNEIENLTYDVAIVDYSGLVAEWRAREITMMFDKLKKVADKFPNRIFLLLNDDHAYEFLPNMLLFEEAIGNIVSIMAE